MRSQRSHYNQCYAEDLSSQRHQSLTGTFLAGQFAQSTRDLPSAAIYFNKALQKAPLNKDILRRAFILNIMNGQINSARELAVRTLGTEPKAQIAHAVLLVVAAKEGRWNDVLNRANKLESVGLLSLLLPPVKGWAHLASGNTDAAINALEPLRENKNTAAMFALHAGLMLELRCRQ